METKSLRTMDSRSGERGEARLKFAIVLLVLIVGGYCGYQYVPVAISSYQYKDEMQQAVDVASARGETPEVLRGRIERLGPQYEIPKNATISVSQEEGRWIARVQFTKEIPFPGYTYKYGFDYTAKSTQMFMAK